MLTFGFKYELTVNGKTSVEPQCFTKYFCCKWARRGSRFEKMLDPTTLRIKQICRNTVTWQSRGAPSPLSQVTLLHTKTPWLR